MPRLAQREENILDFIIRDYVGSASPVSSGRISESEFFKLSPATIRGAMLSLDEEGYLEQPHTSAGRVPTDKAYRYFVNHLMSYQTPPRKERMLFEELGREVHQHHEFLFLRLAKMLSDELRLFTGVASFGEKSKVGGFGLENVFSEPEFDDRNLTVEFSKLVDNLEKLSERFLEGASEARPKVFIGPENPLGPAREFSAVAMKFSDENLGKCVIFSLGPKRMNYEKATSFIDFAVKDIRG